MFWRDSVWLSTLADLLINLSAGWFGVVVATPLLLELTSLDAVVTLLVNIGFGILALVGAVLVRKQKHQAL